MSTKRGKRMKGEKKRMKEQKQLDGQFIRQTTSKACEDRRAWLIKGSVKRTTEALIMAA